jgi:2-dehydropantoate 2-reductase
MDCDMLIVTTKGFDVEAALRLFAGLGKPPAVLLMQNGLGPVEMAQAALGNAAHIYSATMMIGMVRTSPTDATVSGYAAPIGCGSLAGEDSAPLEEMLEVAQNGFIPFTHDQTIRESVLYKLLFNTSMNPTGALTGQPYGPLLENPHTRALIIGLADETLAALSAAYDYRPAETGRAYVEGPLSKIIYPHAVRHESSMLQDMKAGRRTEIDVLNGAVVRLAQENGLSAHRHQTIIDLVKAEEAIRSGAQ